MPHAGEKSVEGCPFIGCSRGAFPLPSMARPLNLPYFVHVNTFHAGACSLYCSLIGFATRKWEGIVTTVIRGAGFAVVAALWTAVALAAASEEPATGTSEGPYAEGVAAADAGDWELAAMRFSEATLADPESADAFNMLAYSQRHLGDLETAIANYGRALELDPRHKGALEYLGEAHSCSSEISTERNSSLQRLNASACSAAKNWTSCAKRLNGTKPEASSAARLL